MPDVTVVIPAGGRGTRMGGSTPKQFLRLAGTTVLQRAIAPFQGLREVREIVLVVPAAFITRTRRLVLQAGFTKVRSIVAGGKERQDSVRNGLACCHTRTGIILVHDAARPLVDRASIRAVVREADRHGAAVVGVKVTDTVKVESLDAPGFYHRTLPREGLWRVQTPQGFRFDILWRAHEEARKTGFIGTDEASLVEQMGIRVKIVPGNDRNIKITTGRDRKMAELLLKSGF
jgi:2-C-methyl-D-erythritol 4-phosphate cytidylyltransferase